MPIRQIPGTDVQYTLIAFDENGHERQETDGQLASAGVLQRLKDQVVPITDVFLMSHGWMGDVPAAIAQYDKWLGAMAALQSDRDAAAQQHPGFNPLIVGLHWPSLPFGDETIPTGGGTLAANADQDASVAALVEAYAARIAGTPAARTAIRFILESARDTPSAAALTPAIQDAYATLFAESGLGSGDVSGRPGADQAAFDPSAIIADARATTGETAGAPGLLGFGDDLRDALLAPLRVLSFWKMKDRARQFGETGAHEFLIQLQSTAPDVRFHLMGHSFGCIVVSAAVAGAPGGRLLPRPVGSLFLVQGALSLWCYADDIPQERGTSGYFRRISQQGLVRGPIVTTRSRFDRACGLFYPLGARLNGQFVLDVEYPVYGAVGAFGIRGTSPSLSVDMPIQDPAFAYKFGGSRIYNIEASRIIRISGGVAGAHNDIAHPEVAHLFWAAILAGQSIVLSEPTGGGGLLGVEPPNDQQERQRLEQQRLQQEQQRLQQERQRLQQEQQQQQQQQQQGHWQAPWWQDEWRSQEQQTRQDGMWPGRHQQSSDQQRGSPEPSSRPGPIVEAAPYGRWMTPAARPETVSLPELRPNLESLTPGGQATAESANQKAAVPAEQRWINAGFEDLAEPLKPGQWYSFALGVDITPQDDTSVPLADQHLFEQDVSEVVLTIQLDSPDFKISDQSRKLTLPRQGKSRKARFDVSPLHEGPSKLKVTIHKDGNFVQQMELTIDVGKSLSAELGQAHGRPYSSANVLKPRDIGLSIAPNAAGGYDCTLWQAVVSRARLPFSPDYLAAAIDAARLELMKVVKYTDKAGQPVFQTGIEISADDRNEALKIMARAGAALFQKIFFGFGAGDDSMTLGTFLGNLLRDRTTRLRLQIVADATSIPWGLLYLGDVGPGAQLDWDYFVGMRHVIEQLPMQATPRVSDYRIPTDKPDLSISVNVNDNIDQQMHATFVAQQHEFWIEESAQRKNVRVTSRNTSAALVGALADDTTDDKILYLYCHAQSTGLNVPGGPDKSCLVLTDALITLGDLRLDAPISKQLSGHPLVFINACESAELSPAFYDGFVPYFMAKGARGVIGTECQTPAMFAMAWAKRFFERFLDGGALGEVFLELRQEFLQQHNNPLGLLYAVHCDGDTQIAPALPRHDA